MTLLPIERDAVRRVRQAFSHAQVAIVGAAALRLAGRLQWRTTTDLDLTVAVDIDAYPGDLEATGLRRDRRLEHRWYTPGDLKVDILPAGPGLRAVGYVEWGGARMNLAGYDLVYRHGTTLDLGDGVSVQIAPIHVVATLKMIAYLDGPDRREKDLQDLAYLLDAYLDEDDERRWGSHVFEAELDFDHASALELGFDVGRIVTSAERPLIDVFLAKVRDNADANGTRPRMLRLGPSRWRDDETVLLRRIDAFQHGLDRARQPVPPP